MGYQKLTIPAGGYALLANPFTIVGSDGETFAINDMFTDDVDKSKAGNSAGLSDQIQGWDPTQQGYNAYFFSARITGGGKAWATMANARVATTNSFEPSEGFWYLSRGSNSYQLTVSGEVSTNNVSVTLLPGYNLVCNPFPVDLPLNTEDIDWIAAGAHAGNSAGLSDQIQLWDIDNQGYNAYFFSARITGGGKAWATMANARVATTESIPAGQGFWYLNRGDNTISITLKSPLAKE